MEIRFSVSEASSRTHSQPVRWAHVGPAETDSPQRGGWRPTRRLPPPIAPLQLAHRGSHFGPFGTRLEDAQSDRPNWPQRRPFRRSEKPSLEGDHHLPLFWEVGAFRARQPAPPEGRFGHPNMPPEKDPFRARFDARFEAPAACSQGVDTSARGWLLKEFGNPSKSLSSLAMSAGSLVVPWRPIRSVGPGETETRCNVLVETGDFLGFRGRRTR